MQLNLEVAQLETLNNWMDLQVILRLCIMSMGVRVKIAISAAQK
jgi:hypothetical protein